jgi:hypothetical protein
MLGSKLDIPTKRLARWELDKRLAVVNDPIIVMGPAYCDV